jgi:hypothetical protein
MPAESRRFLLEQIEQSYCQFMVVIYTKLEKRGNESFRKYSRALLTMVGKSNLDFGGEVFAHSSVLSFMRAFR